MRASVYAVLVGVGPLGLLLPFYNDPVHKRQILLEARRMVSSFAAQVMWRFMVFCCFPFRWSVYAHPAADAQTQERVLREFFTDMQDCCRGKDFCKKVLRYTCLDH